MLHSAHTLFVKLIIQKAAISGATAVFGAGGTLMQGCYFHLRQAIWRKIQQVIFNYGKSQCRGSGFASISRNRIRANAYQMVSDPDPTQ